MAEAGFGEAKGSSESNKADIDCGDKRFKVKRYCKCHCCATRILERKDNNIIKIKATIFEETGLLFPPTKGR